MMAGLHPLINCSQQLKHCSGIAPDGTVVQLTGYMSHFLMTKRKRLKILLSEDKGWFRYFHSFSIMYWVCVMWSSGIREGILIVELDIMAVKWLQPVVIYLSVMGFVDDFNSVYASCPKGALQCEGLCGAKR